MHDGRGLCAACVTTLRRHDPDALLDYPTAHCKREDAIDTYRRLRAQHGAEITLAEIAAHLGMTHAALERALTRARRAGELPPHTYTPSPWALRTRRQRAAKAAERAA